MKGEAAVQEWMSGATFGDREGHRITYGSFVRMMTHTVKQVGGARRRSKEEKQAIEAPLPPPFPTLLAY